METININSNPLPWNKIGWKEFEYLSLYLAESLIPGVNFSAYLKQGNFQSGIDLKSGPTLDGFYVTIQCKKIEKTINLKIEDVVNEFLSHQFALTSRKFILCTTLDFQNEKDQNTIRGLTEKLRQRDMPIIFECWDVNFITERLKNEYSIVQQFFDIQTADEYCFKRIRHFGIQKRESELDFIERKITPITDIYEDNSAKLNFFQRESVNLSLLIAQNRLKRKFICVIGDAYQGKSILLRQTAFEIENIPIAYTSLLIELKSFNSIPIHDMLDTYYGNWKQVAAKDLVIFIDGLDEVPTDKFIETVNLITNFSVKYHNVNIVFSCRKLFYAHHEVAKRLTDCTVYELLPLNYLDVNNYLKIKLKEQSLKFEHLVNNRGMSNLLYQPFYLNTLIQEFQKPPHNIPSSKSSIIEKFIDSSDKYSSLRLISGGRQVHERMVMYRTSAQKFAFALQLAGLNAIDSDIVQQILSESEIELLKQNSLITKIGKQWSFGNAIFQEHLAAMFLAKLSFAEIVKHVSIGKKIKKIRTKWIQTMSSLFSFLPVGTLQKQLLELIKKDNIELLFTTESSKYTSAVRIATLKSFIKKCIFYHIRTIVVYEEVIASFLLTDSTAVDYLLVIVKKREVDIRVKIVAIRILTELYFSPEQKRKAFSFFFKEIINITDAHFAKSFMEILVRNKIGNRELILKLISNKALQADHEYRDGVYRLITKLEMVDDFYEYGLDGMEALIQHNKRISHYGSEYSLEDFLANTNNPRHLIKLLSKIRQREWLGFYQYGERKKRFLKKVCTKAILFYAQYPWIIFAVVEYIKEIARHYLREEFDEIDHFFEATGSNWLAIRILAPNILQDRDWELSGFITEESFDFLLFEFEEGNSSLQIIRSWIYALEHKGKEDIGRSFFKIIEDATGGELSKPIEPRVDDKYKIAEKLRIQNDLLYFLSIENFKTGIHIYFNAYGKNGIPESEVYVDEEQKPIRQQANSTLIYNFLTNWLTKREKVYLKDALDIISEPGNFEYFRAQQALHYHFENEEAKKQIIDLVADYYQKEIKYANFVNCIWSKEHDNGHIQLFWRTKEQLLGSLFETFGFETPTATLMEMVWLDSSGTRTIEMSRTNNRKSLSMLVLERLSEPETETFKQKVVQNIEIGILADGVLGNHIGLCNHMKIAESKFQILELLKKQKKVSDFIYFVDTYIKLGGETKALLPVFKKSKGYKSYEYFHIVKILIDAHPAAVKKSLLDYFNDNIVELEERVNAARYLCTLGVNEAFAFLVNRVRVDKKSPYTIQGKISVKPIDTKFALKTMDDIMYLLVTTESEQVHFSEGPKNILLEWLNEFATKSENDLLLVYEFMLKKQKDLQNDYVNHYDLFWFAFQVVEKLRDADKTVKTVDEIKHILNAISNSASN